MKNIGVAVMVAFAIVGGALAFTTLLDQPAKPGAGMQDLTQMMAHAKSPPVEGHSVELN